MSFQDFCSKAYEIDKQIVETSDSFVIHFKKETGTAFTVDPNDIIQFLRFLVLNHTDCVSAIQNDERFSKESYLNYDEKPYRALYRLTAKAPELKTIYSLGGSQTKELTKVISKLICYLAQIDYLKVEENTHFDLESLNLALKNTPKDIKEISQKNAGSQPISRRKAFFNWLLNQGKKERTASSYSGTVLNVANATLAETTSPGEFDLINNPAVVYELHEKLKQVESWVNRNDSGGGMYDAGLNSYRDFVSELYQSAVTAKSASPALTLSKPFLLLAGISGTGKSRFVRKQAEAQGSEQEFFQLVPVRPDWHEPSDLLGYVSRIGVSPKFVATDTLRFIVRAWKATGAQTITLPNGKTGWWSAKMLDEIKTYWLCLDEMNLAPVEQYFADYLSVIESRHWLNAGELSATGKDYVYTCLPILSASSLKAVEIVNQAELAKDLGLDIQSNTSDQKLWDSFLQHGISVPFNLVVAGTVNMDETTHGFSRKVIDRALTFDFGRFFPNEFDQVLAPQTQPQPIKLDFPRLSNASAETLADCKADPTGQKTIGFLKAINQVLTDTPFELAYRALNELLLAVVCHRPENDEALQAVWDDFLMCKVLPRIDGDDEKLASFSGSTQSAQTILDELQKTLSIQLSNVWETTRPDLLRKEAGTNAALPPVPCRSKAKLEWMKNRLERNSFTSFWP
jgi:hypothetical protein